MNCRCMNCRCAVVFRSRTANRAIAACSMIEGLSVSRSRQRPCCCHRRRTSMIGVETLLRIVCRRLKVLPLYRSRSNMVLVHRHPLLRPWCVAKTACATGIGDTIDVHIGRLMHDSFIDVDVAEPSAHMHNRCVVEEVAAAPFAARKAPAHIAESIVHAAVVADMRSPVACVKEINAVLKAPVRRRPKNARFRRRHPCARHPVVPDIGVVISPIPWRPDISIRWAQRLLIHRQHRRSNGDVDKHSGKRRCRHEAKQKRKQEKSQDRKSVV